MDFRFFRKKGKAPQLSCDVEGCYGLQACRSQMHRLNKNAPAPPTPASSYAFCIFRKKAFPYVMNVK